MKKLIILGTGGNCLEILDAVRAVNRANPRPLYECAGFLDDNPASRGQEFGGVRVLGPLTNAAGYADCAFVNGIGSPANFWRKPEIIRTTGLGLERFETIIHPKADVSEFARLGHGCVILAGAAVGARAELGPHVILLQGAVIGHDGRVADCCSLASGACLAGDVKVGAASYVGANASVRSGVKIGARSLVGMGSVVLRDVADNSVVVGNPARFLRALTP